MFSRNWLSYIALGGILVLGLCGPLRAETTDNGPLKEKPSPQKTETEGGIKTPGAGAGGTSASQAHDNGTSDHQPKHNGGTPDYFVFGDTWAQWVMALSGIAAIVVSVVAVVLVKRTLEETRKALKEANRAADAAEEAVDITRALGAIEMRAFISAGGILAFYEETDDLEYNWRFRVSFQNSGKTPTVGMVHYTGYQLHYGDFACSPAFTAASPYKGTGHIAPGRVEHGGQVPPPDEPAITPADIWAIQNGQAGLVIFGWIKYRDVFPETPEHITRFSWIVDPVGDPFAVDANKTMRFSYILYSEGNCADEECTERGYPWPTTHEPPPDPEAS